MAKEEFSAAEKATMKARSQELKSKTKDDPETQVERHQRHGSKRQKTCAQDSRAGEKARPLTKAQDLVWHAFVREQGR